MTSRLCGFSRLTLLPDLTAAYAGSNRIPSARRLKEISCSTPFGVIQATTVLTEWTVCRARSSPRKSLRRGMQLN
jgi:hypothetical protein